MICAQDISFAYDGTLVLDGVGVSAHRDQVVGLIGPNGSGKTTLLRILYAALTPRAGLVTVADRPVGALSPTGVARRIAVVAQEGAPELPLTVADMVLLGRSPLLDGGTLAYSGPTDAVLTPEVLEPVYGIAVRRLVEPDCVQLIFQPHGSTTTEETR